MNNPRSRDLVVLQCVSVWCSVLQCGGGVVARGLGVMRCQGRDGSVVQCGAVWCSVVQCAAVCCSVLQCAAAALAHIVVWCRGRAGSVL